MNNSIIISFILLLPFLFVQSQTTIIDMHVRPYTQSDFGGREPARDHDGKKGSDSSVKSGDFQDLTQSIKKKLISITKKSDK